ncbi:MAG: hypothetical protein ACI88G_002268, partial [Woeseiaceae bacterium]
EDATNGVRRFGVPIANGQQQQPHSFSLPQSMRVVTQRPVSKRFNSNKIQRLVAIT